MDSNSRFSNSDLILLHSCSFCLYIFQGFCNKSSNPPTCTNCIAGWMGPACEDPCTNGTQVPMDSGNCVCDPCFTGRGCNVECTGHGICVGNKCQCDQLTGWRGSLCEVPGCPGSNGKDCSGNGKCDSANHRCICLPGRQGEHLVVLLRKVLFGRIKHFPKQWEPFL